MTIGLVYAMPGEIETLLTDETRTPIRTEAGVSFYQIRPHIIACCCGVSKVNAAMGAQLLHQPLPPGSGAERRCGRLLVNVPIGTIVLAEGFVQHDVDTTAIGDPVGLVSTVNQIQFPTADLRPARAAMDATGVPYRTGWVATGALVRHRKPPAPTGSPIPFHPLLCEMEGWRRGAGVPAERGEGSWPSSPYRTACLSTTTSRSTSPRHEGSEPCGHGLPDPTDKGMREGRKWR